MKTLLRFVIFLLFFVPQYTFGQNIDSRLNTRQAPLPCVDKTFSIVAHIVRDSFGEPNILEDDILAAIIGLNDAFEPICIDFEVCEFRFIDNFQYDFIRETNFDNNDWDEMQNQFNIDRRINMYFVTGFNFMDLRCGFSTFSGITQIDTGGVVIQKDCLEPGSQTIAHNVGHYFGLYRTFEGTPGELVDGSNALIAGDSIADTPADPYIITDPIEDYIDVENCRFIDTGQDANQEYFAPHVGNIMSYYPDPCRCSFSHEQYLKMANTFLNSEDKTW